MCLSLCKHLVFCRCDFWCSLNSFCWCCVVRVAELICSLPTAEQILTANPWTEDFKKKKRRSISFQKIHSHHFLHLRRVPACTGKVKRLITVVWAHDCPQAVWDVNSSFEVFEPTQALRRLIVSFKYLHCSFKRLLPFRLQMLWKPQFRQMIQYRRFWQALCYGCL